MCAYVHVLEQRHEVHDQYMCDRDIGSRRAAVKTYLWGSCSVTISTPISKIGTVTVLGTCSDECISSVGTVSVTLEQ